MLHRCQQELSPLISGSYARRRRGHNPEQEKRLKTGERTGGVQLRHPASRSSVPADSDSCLRTSPIMLLPGLRPHPHVGPRTARQLPTAKRPAIVLRPYRRGGGSLSLQLQLREGIWASQLQLREGFCAPQLRTRAAEGRIFLPPYFHKGA